MKRRFTATAVLIGSIGAFAFGLWALLHTREFASLVCCVSEEPIDSEDWSFHWTVAAWSWIAIGLGGAIAAVALFRRRRWSMALLAIIGASSVAFDIAVNLLGYAKYAYEMIDPVQVIVFALLAVTSFVAYLRWEIDPQSL